MVAIIPRAQWGAAFGLSPNRVGLNQRRFFVLHWPGGAVSADEAQMVRNIERQHRQTQGWSAAPGYNFLVGQSGAIFEGAGRDIRGVHSPPRNIDGFGVCVLHPTTAPPSQAALNATRALYDHLNAVVGRPLHASWHSADVPTGCPGPALVAWVRAGMPATGTPAPPPPSIEEITMRVIRQERTQRVFITDGITKRHIGEPTQELPDLLRLCGQTEWINVADYTIDRMPEINSVGPPESTRVDLANINRAAGQPAAVAEVELPEP